MDKKDQHPKEGVLIEFSEPGPREEQRSFMAEPDHHDAATAHELDLAHPVRKHCPTGYYIAWHLGGFTAFFTRNLILTRLPTPGFDCWTVEPAPLSVKQSEWMALDVSPKTKGAAVFYRGHVVGRIWMRKAPEEPNLQFMERASAADYARTDSDRYPPRTELGVTCRWLADGSISYVNHGA